MIDITAFEEATNLCKPRRIRKYVLVWCSSGTATLVVDENEFELKANWLNRKGKPYRTPNGVHAEYYRIKTESAFQTAYRKDSAKRCPRGPRTPHLCIK